MRRLAPLFALAYCLGPSHVLADQISLKNGDRLSGTITKSDGKTLVLHTADAGDITINWPAVESVKSDKDLRVELPNGKTAVGVVTTSDNTVQVATSSGQVAAPLSDVKSLAQEADYEKTVHASLLENWKGGANVGFSLTRGNSETSNFALSFLAARQTLRDKLGLYANSVFARSTIANPGAVPPAPLTTTTTTANTAGGGLRYDRNLDDKLFAFVAADFFADALQSLNLRSVFGGGLGYHAIKNDNTTLDFLGGLNYTHESYDAFTRNLVALTLGEELMHKLGKSTVLNQSLYLFPDLNNLGEFRGTFNLATVTKINKRFGWQNAFADIYVSNPPTGKRQNDVILTTGLNVSFGQ